MIPIDLAGKTALVTGGGQGLGAETATLLARAGATVIVNYFDDPAGLNRQRAEDTAAAIGNGAVALEADVRRAESVDALFGAIAARFEHLDIVVNNAAIVRDKTLRKMADADWQAVIDTNLTGVFHVCRAAANALADGGRIVNISSISGFLGFFGQANYAAAKAGVVGLTHVMCREVARRRITVNAVAPGVALTEMGRTIPDDIREAMLKQVPLGRFAEPAEIASAVLFLCSDLAAYMTGQVLHVSGGWYV
jgi:3-oxoacyl-[acyl-carrier protein] reductase